MLTIDPIVAAHHAAVRNAGGFHAPQSRGLVEVTGRDRASFVHNLTTNAVNTLQPGDGNYAFAINVQGRTLFDLNILVHADGLWLDIDRRWTSTALAHFEKYVVIEDVSLADISAVWARFWVFGPATGMLVERLGFPAHFATFPALQHVPAVFADQTAHVVRHDLGPIMRAEFYVPAPVAPAFAERLEAEAPTLGMVACDGELATMIRLEAGYPASVEDIDDRVIPPETRQTERGICHVKGCYLGQEIIERLRSRGGLARRLVGYRVEGDAVPPHDAPVFADGEEIGRVTSARPSVGLGAILAMGYAKTELVKPGSTLLVGIDAQRAAPTQFVDLPLPIWRNR